MFWKTVYNLFSEWNKQKRRVWYKMSVEQESGVEMCTCAVVGKNSVLDLIFSNKEMKNRTLEMWKSWHGIEWSLLYQTSLRTVYSTYNNDKEKLIKFSFLEKI